MQLSKKAIDLIKRFEPFEAEPRYRGVGRVIIGYGHIIEPLKEKYNSQITEIDGDRILRRDLSVTEYTINKGVEVVLTQGQYDALTSLVFYWGGVNFLKSSGIRLLNNGDYHESAKEFFRVDSKMIKNQTDKMESEESLIQLIERRRAELLLWHDAF